MQRDKGCDYLSINFEGQIVLLPVKCSELIETLSTRTGEGDGDIC